MLIEFSVGNYRSFKEKVTFSMVAAEIVAQDKKLDQNNVFLVSENFKLLKSAAIYGANASGKSNLAKALEFMRWFMINSSKDTQSTDLIRVERFRLSTETDLEPSFFEIVFLLNGQKYRYGFEATPEQVISEWLFYVPNLRETKLFERDGDKIESTKKYNNPEGLKKITRKNALFLSVCAQFNVEIAENILESLRKINIISGLIDQQYKMITIDFLLGKQKFDNIIQLIRNLDLGIQDIYVNKRDITYDILPNHIPDELKNIILKNGPVTGTEVQTIHTKFDNQGNIVSHELFNLEAQESEGTQKIFSLAGPLVDTLEEGKVLIIDEFDARLHPLISREIVQLFNSNNSNPKNAQLIFMTHDTNLLSNKLFRRDQIWFTEKNRYGATDLYSLVEYKGVRNDASFENDYIRGKYGAIPYIHNLNYFNDYYE